MVLEPEVVGDPAGGREVAGAGGAGREGVHRAVGVLPVPGHERRHQAGVEAAGEEDADRDVGHHPAAYGEVEDVAQQHRGLGAVGQLGPRDVELAEAAQPGRRRPAMAGRELGDQRPVLLVEGADLRGEQRRPADVGPVERLDADRVAGDDEVSPAVVGHGEGVHAAQVAERVRVVADRGRQRGLGVGVGPEVARRDLAQLLVVVDLAVHHRPVAVARGQRLVAGSEVDDREPDVAEPGRSDLAAPVAVRAAVPDPLQHPLAEHGVGSGRVVDRDDAAHGQESRWVDRVSVAGMTSPGTTGMPIHQLNDGAELPAVGFGTAGLRGEDATTAVLSAIEQGYRLIDTAVNYENESEVGEAVRRTDVPREELRITSKIPGRDHGYDDAIRSTRESLERLGLEQLDLHLIHWPNPSQGKYVEAWRALVQLQRDGLVRSIGVSNFTREHLGRIIDDTGVPPTVNQIELHPYFPQGHMREVDDELGIVTESWSPIGKREAPFTEPPVADAAERLGVTPAQVILRWQVQLGNLPIPKSATPSRQRENLDVFGFELTHDEVAAITGLGRNAGRLFGGDPDTHEEM